MSPQQEVPKTQAAPVEQTMGALIDDIIRNSEAGSSAHTEAVQMKSDFAYGRMYIQGTGDKAGNPADIAMRVQFGRTLGLGQFQSARGIFFNKGIPGLMGTALEVLMARHGYRWNFIQRDDKGCILELTKCGIVVMDGAKPARASFTEVDAKKAKLDQKDTYKQDPESMYYWRALGRLQKFYVPEATDYVSVLMPGQVDFDEVVAETETRTMQMPERMSVVVAEEVAQ